MSKLRIGFMLSGSGSTLANLSEQIDSGAVNAEVVAVISSRAKNYGVERARNMNTPVHIVKYRDYENDLDLYSDKITECLDEHNVDLIVMGGFMSFYKVPEKYIGKIINVHPALLPSFGGQDMYGHHVHEAVLEYGAKITGCTVHFVDNESYDHGPIIMQGVVQVEQDDTPDSLADKVQDKEREIYPQVVQLFAEGRVTLNGRKVTIK